MPKLLIVEDERIIREPFMILLQAQGYDVDEAANGQEALELCRHTTYDLILLDLMMPVMDGVAFLQQASLHTTAPNTRVVVMSNLSSGTMLTEALELGANGHAIKSDLAPRDVIALVQTELAAIRV